MKREPAQHAARQLGRAPDHRPWYLLIIAAVVPLVATIILRRLNIPLGCPGRFVYLYSPVVGWRLQSALVALPIGGALALSIWFLAGQRIARRLTGLALLIIPGITLGMWSWYAPPYHVNQHVFNTHSPSHDGAFVKEAVDITSVRDYLHNFPQRAASSPAELRGTRVISNPPGATLLAVAVDRVAQHRPHLVAWLAQDFREATPTQHLLRWTTTGLAFFMVLIALWLLSGAALYALARLLLTPASAACFALCCVFNPMTLLFVPGKDPAQLLSVALPALCWLLAWRRRSIVCALIAGALATLATVASLVHIWIALILLGATLLDARRESGGPRRWLFRTLLPATLASVATVLLLWLCCDFNLPATLLAVAHAQGTVTRGPDAMPLAWQLLGLPLFALFAGPALWTVGLFNIGAPDGLPHAADRDARFGRYLLLLTALVMLATAGFTNLETPRLWIPFAPFLLLGFMLQLAPLRAPQRRVALLLAALVWMQVAVVALQWAQMDPRETEMRLSEQRYLT